MHPDDLNPSGSRILIADGTPEIPEQLSSLLCPVGYRTSFVSDPEAFSQILRDDPPDLIVLGDMGTGAHDPELRDRAKLEAIANDIPIVFIAEGRDPGSIGYPPLPVGRDFILKPFHRHDVLMRIHNQLTTARMSPDLVGRNTELESRARELACANRALQEEVDRLTGFLSESDRLKQQFSALSRRETERWGIPDFVGRSETLKTILGSVQLMQEAASTPVLIMGENGTGKELIARAIHFGSRRASGPFLPINCATIPLEMAESLLFGHVRGAFTGADRDQAGHFELADTGTIFLDEIGEMPVGLQVKLLRILEDGRIQPLGARQARKVDVRIVAATNANLVERMSEGAFRQDLYFRLAHYTVYVPPLRERKEDIRLLAEHFLGIFAADMGRKAPALSRTGLEALETYGFPGNVRELKNMMERALLECDGQEIQPRHLHFFRTVPQAVAGTTPKEKDGSLPWPDFERQELEQVRDALTKTKGNITKAARLLGINRTRIYRLLRKYTEMPE